MKRIALLMGTIAIVLLLVTGSRLFAGVVIAETMVSSGPSGGQVETRTVYTHGDKRKVEERGIDVITDLDRDVLYVVDKNQREYAEIPLRAFAMPRAGDGGTALETIHFHGTKSMRVIANLPCWNTAGWS